MKPSRTAPRPTVICGGQLIDGTGGAPIPRGTVVLEDSRITAAGPDSDFEGSDWTGFETIDAQGGTIMPGLVQAHDHIHMRWSYGSFAERVRQPREWVILRAARNALMSLAEGWTTFRDLGSPDAISLVVRKAIDDGLIVGPRIVACGQFMAMTGSHGADNGWVADGEDEVRKGARVQLGKDADFIKCMASGSTIGSAAGDASAPTYTVAEMRAAFDEAAKNGKPTTVHAHSPVSIRNAVDAGVTCIEHAAFIDRPTADLLAQKGIWVVPTVIHQFGTAKLGRDWGRPLGLVEQMEQSKDARLERYTYLVEAGCKLAVGTDMIGTMQWEMELMHQGGLDAMSVIVAATRNGAEVCNILDRTGTLEPGKEADVLVVDGDPLADLSAVGRVKRVITRGVPYRPEDLAAAIGARPL